MKKIVEKHKVALFLAIAISLVYGSHHIFTYRLLKEKNLEYTPVTVAGNFDEGMYYALRAKRAYDGNLFVGEVSLKEYEGPTFLPILNPIIMASLGRIFGGLQNGFIASDFILPPLIFLTIYFLAFEIIGGKMSAIIFASIFMFFPKFGLFPSSGAFPFSSSARELYFSRFEYPAVTFFFFTSAILFLFRAIRNQTRKDIVLSGIFFGSLFFTYLYDWLYFGTAIFILGLLFLLSKNYEKILTLIKIWAIGLTITLPYWLNLLTLKQWVYFEDIKTRMGFEIGRQFRAGLVWPSYIRVILLSLSSILIFRKTHLKWQFLTAFLLPIIFLLNIQLITGFSPQPDHFHRVTFLIIGLSVFITLQYIWKNIIPNKKIINSIFASLIITFSFCFGIWSEYNFSKINYLNFTIPESRREVLDWIEENTKKDAVIGTLDPILSSEIILHTGRYVFLPAGFNTIGSTEEIWQRAFTLSKILSIANKDFGNYVTKENFFLFSDTFYPNTFNKYIEGGDRTIPTNIREGRVLQYEKWSTGEDLELDYIIIGNYERDVVVNDILLTKNGLRTYNKNGFSIYKIK